jgi:2',3'-cyclic-nucleotide 2'-phosphodiesterase (5'-nucleotidase family)
LRHTETAFACLIAECIKHSYREQNCQLGIINGGFIRRDRVYKVGSVLTSADLKEELPFPRFPVLLRMKGSDIKLALEQMISRCPDPVGCFPHLSDEWTAEYDLDRVPMDRVHSIRYKGTPMDLEEHYLVGVTDFYASKGGDGVDAYMGKEVVANHERTVCDCALEYFKLKQVISGRLPLRFTPSPNVR